MELTAAAVRSGGAEALADAAQALEGGGGTVGPDALAACVDRAAGAQDGRVVQAALVLWTAARPLCAAAGRAEDVAVAAACARIAAGSEWHETVRNVARRVYAGAARDDVVAAVAAAVRDGAGALRFVLEQASPPRVRAVVPAVLGAICGFYEHHETAVVLEAIASTAVLLGKGTPTELREHGLVLFRVLLDQLSSRDPAILNASLPCMTVALRVLEPDVVGSERYALAMETLVRDLEMYVSRLDQARVFARHLAAFVAQMGVACVPYTGRLVAALDELTGFADTKVRVGALDALDKVIEQCWVRVPAHATHIVGILVFVFLDSPDMPAVCESAVRVARRLACVADVADEARQLLAPLGAEEEGGAIVAALELAAQS